MTKTCTCCHQALPADRYFFSIDKRENLTSWCKACRAKKSREWYEARGRLMRGYNRTHPHARPIREEAAPVDFGALMAAWR